MNGLRVRVYRGPAAAEGASIALKHRLYVSGWKLSHELTAMRDRPQANQAIAIAFLNGVPVAVAAINNWKNIQAFTRKSLRGQGLASACVKRIRTSDCYALSGVQGSEQFWNRVGVHCNG